MAGGQVILIHENKDCVSKYYTHKYASYSYNYILLLRICVHTCPTLYTDPVLVPLTAAAHCAHVYHE